MRRIQNDLLKYLPSTTAEAPKQAVILAAGLGSRLAKSDKDIKPLKDIAGKSLIRRNLELLVEAGIPEVLIVTGYHAEALQAQIQRDSTELAIDIHFKHNADYKKSNGLSVLCAKDWVKGSFLLLMADHLFEPKLMKAAAKALPPKHGALLCVDFKVESVFDLDDATKVFVRDGQIASIGKQIQNYNAIDTGLFICTPAIFTALDVAAKASPLQDCSLSEGIAEFIKTGRMFIHDIGPAHWQDVDDEAMLSEAERFVHHYLGYENHAIGA